MPIFAGDRFCGACGHSIEDATWTPVIERLRGVLAGEFDIEGELGRGGMSAVFRARELALNRRVAIKVMAPGLLVSDGMVDRFRQEAITVANLQHANIVAVYSVRTVGDLHLFVMQYVPGRSLDRILRDDGRLSVTAVRAIVYHVASALDYAHRRGVIHRDVKPANILLDGDGDPVVTDFGIAKVAETPGYTRVGMIVGTPTYMSPEQCTGKDVCPASDQYALGIVAYEMLAGRPPFSGNPMAMLRAHVEDAPPPLRSIHADIPETIDAAVMRMLAKAPPDRFPDLATAIEAFDAHPLSALGPVRAEMSALAAAADAEGSIAEIVRAPRSPIPASRVQAPPSTPAGDRAARTLRAVVASVALDAPTEPLEVGECVVVDATPRTERGTRVEAVRLTWESSDPNVATVDSAGVVTAVGAGTASITVAAAQARNSIDVVVIDPQVATIEVEAPAEVRSGTRATLSARALDRHGKAMDTTVTWVSRNPSFADITPDGVLVARRRGVAVVVAQAAGVARAVTVAIAPPPVTAVVIDGMPPAIVPGASVTLRGIVRMARTGDDDPDRPIEWKSSDPSIATVSADGVLTARKTGRAIVSATSEGVRSEAEVNVVAVRADSIVIAPPPSPFRVGDKATLKATVYDARGTMLPRQVAWRSSDTRVVTTDESGRVSAVGEGWAIVTARIDGIESPVELVVRQQIVPVSEAGRRESRRLALRWWVLLAALAGTIALGWNLLRR
jgi:serine/threonine-protein kinase